MPFVVVLITKSWLTLLWPPWTVACQALHPWDFPGKNTGVGCHFLLQGIFPAQRLNPHLLHCRQILYHWATTISPNILWGWRKWLNRKSVAEKNKKRKPEPLSESYRMLTSGGSQQHRYKARSTTVHWSPFTRLAPPSSSAHLWYMHVSYFDGPSWSFIR